MPPLVVRTRASSTVFVKASSRVKRDLGGIFYTARPEGAEGWGGGYYELVGGLNGDCENQRFEGGGRGS